MSDTTLIKSLVAAIANDPEAMAELAEAMGPLVATRTALDDPWIDTKQAAIYLGFGSTSPIKKLTAARTIPFEQDAPGGKCWFKVSALDRWRQGGG
jgi:hypothetical protein